MFPKPSLLFSLFRNGWSAETAAPGGWESRECGSGLQTGGSPVSAPRSREDRRWQEQEVRPGLQDACRCGDPGDDPAWCWCSGRRSQVWTVWINWSWIVIVCCLFFGQFPEMADFIHGEESNKFENGLGNDLILFLTHYMFMVCCLLWM